MASSRRSRWRDFLFPRTEDKIYNTTNVLLIRGLVTVIFFPLFSCFLLKMNNNKAVCYTFATQSHIYSWLTVLYMAMANDLPYFLWSFFGYFFWGVFFAVSLPRIDRINGWLYCTRIALSTEIYRWGTFRINGQRNRGRTDADGRMEHEFPFLFSFSWQPEKVIWIEQKSARKASHSLFLVVTHNALGWLLCWRCISRGRWTWI